MILLLACGPSTIAVGDDTGLFIDTDADTDADADTDTDTDADSDTDTDIEVIDDTAEPVETEADVYVDCTGGGDYTTIADAIASVQ